MARQNVESAVWRLPCRLLEVRLLLSCMCSLQEHVDMRFAANSADLRAQEISSLQCLLAIRLQRPPERPCREDRRHPSHLVAVRVSAAAKWPAEHAHNVGQCNVESCFLPHL